MLHAIIRFSIKNKLIIGIFIVALISWGSYEVTQLPIDAVPDITNNQVLVITSAPSLGAPDVERFITVPVEQATRNVPGIIEQRSFSRFGLSLVTIVFNDATDVYWARQQVSERLIQVRQQIPTGMGDPQLGPVTTGLGEIFQYVVKPKPGYEGKYDLAALRDIQDWIVRRQLLGTEGVADVSSFGGKVKQYEVAVNPDKLKNFGLTIANVFKALQDNNQNTGGAYIEKGPNVLFIRSEGLTKGLDDIGNIVVKQINGSVPVLVKDIAEVKYGNAIRYGAVVYNDESEVAGAVVMMLKGANSNVVIENIKKKIADVEKTLPEGVEIVPFLDRTKMVNNAISTVEHNLLEGALIVVFVLVLFLGNLRAGFIVASVIPLSMLFAVIMMNLFGVSGNLMSLGALDFGLLVDGAVIIVEAVMHKLSHGKLYSGLTKLSQHDMDAEVQVSANKMMNSAVFGQIIILIVYLPILSLQGIEGKMFKPMAETVSFAIIGAFILSLTYVPMVSALFISKKLNHKESFADKMIHRFQEWYAAALKRALKIPIGIAVSAVILFGIAVYILTTLGGEFIPQLEEGDFAVDTRLLTGSSLSNTISTTEKAASVLLKQFPEVEKVVSKIGSGEIPTDPMPLEAADMMVILKDKKEWTSAKSFPELANKMSVALDQVPGVATGFQFPVQMRFNELMTGARQDVVCKIFGDDLDTLAAYADKISKIIATVNGAKDLYKETVTGVPQLVINYNRGAIARYGANISDINNTIQSAYAGATAGLVFENDKRYDLVIRMNDSIKQDPQEISNLLIGLPDVTQVPLNILASVELKDGPYQIQREDARRRIAIGFNVRDRDVQSIVSELQQKVLAQVKFPAGYYIQYGGQYENLQHATQRLSIALPVALLLIFLMLFFAFNKIKYGLLIFSAIPLSAIGGVWALWIRDMPFSISAGVGFIALFGVAVLNGIVMITEMNRLQAEGNKKMQEIIITAAKTRLRPVLMTAAVASLGFLPMALSNGAGAEVQRPLATVVIGGLITATLLTLFVLPSLYILFEKGLKKKLNMQILPVILICFILPFAAQSQEVKTITLDSALSTALQQNRQLIISRMNEKYFATLSNATTAVPLTQLTAEAGKINSNATDNKFQLTQSFALPVLYRNEKNIYTQQAVASGLQTKITEADIIKLVKQYYLQLQYLTAKQQLLIQTDSIYSRFNKIAALRYTKGESNILEKINLDNEMQQLNIQLQMLNTDKLSVLNRLMVLLNTNEVVDAADSFEYRNIFFDSTLINANPLIVLNAQKQKVAEAQTKFEKAKLLPEFMVGYTNQTITGYQKNTDGSEQYYGSNKRFSAVQFGVGIPLFNKSQKARINAAKENEKIAAANTELTRTEMQANLIQVWNDYQKYKTAFEYYRHTGLQQAQLIVQTAATQYSNGEINYIEWAALMNKAIGIRNNYIETLKQLNLAQIELDYLLSNKN